MSKMTAIQELEKIRTKLLPPAKLWAWLSAEFKANDRSRDAVTRQVSPGDPPKTVWRLEGTDCKATARTKSEARSLLKKLVGRLPAGSVVVKDT